MTNSSPAPNPDPISLDGRPRIREFFQSPAEHSHIVQFYEDDGPLVENVAAFLAEGLRVGEPVVVIATPEHRAAFVEELGRLGFDDLTPERGVTMLDARETLALLMEEGMPSWNRFSTEVGGMIDQILRRSGAPRVRAYGEMVNLLWCDGNRKAAVLLESHWNQLGAMSSFTLLCAYAMASFIKTGDAASFHEVCRTHSHVIPVESERTRALEQEVAHRRELEIALRESLARENALRAVAEREVHFAEVFAAMLGHDLRNPLGTIAMGAQYIARANAGEKNTKAAMRIIGSAERMSRMIEQLLDFSRIRAVGGLVLNRSRVELAEVCERVKEEIEAVHPHCTIQMKASGNTDGVWDRDRLLQVFSNLLGNAVTHGTSGCQVGIEADGNDPSNVVAFVRNEGSVDPAIMPLLFDAFRGGKKRHNATGLGLGLYITRQIVLAHGGEIAVTSSDIGGTLVCVKLPRFSRDGETSDTLKV